MAIYHLTATIISRGRGQSAVAAAAYRAGDVLRDERYGVTQNYAGKTGTVHAEILAPGHMPSWACDRESLWNRVEASELRKDSQLARLIEVGLPIELSSDERVALMREFIAAEFVANGMIADFCIRGLSKNPQAHIMLTLRALTPTGFGPKQRRWNGKAVLLGWRAAWAAHANEHLARAGHGVRIDHRTLDAQQIELTPSRRIGVRPARRTDPSLPEHLIDRIADQQRIARDNGLAIIADPTVALRAMTHQRATFTEDDLAQFLRFRTSSAAQFDAALLGVTASPELVALKSKDDGPVRYTSRDMLEAAKSISRRAASMSSRGGNKVPAEIRDPVAAGSPATDADRRVYEYLLGSGDLKAVALPKTRKIACMSAAKRPWEAQGMSLLVLDANALAQAQDAWQQGRDLPGRGMVLWIDDSQMLGLKQLERLLAVADKGRAKVVLCGDLDRLASLRVELPFRDVLAQVGIDPRDSSGAREA